MSERPIPTVQGFTKPIGVPAADRADEIAREITTQSMLWEPSPKSKP